MGRRNVDFFCAVVIVGLLAGVAGLATTLLLRSIEHLTYHYTFGSLLQGVAGSSPARRAVGPMIGGGLAGLGWWMLRSRADVPQLNAAIAKGERIRLLPFGFDAALQVLVVGSGASLGREGAPRQLAAEHNCTAVSPMAPRKSAPVKTAPRRSAPRKHALRRSASTK